METLFYTLWFLLSLSAVVHLLVFKREPSSTIAWLLFVIFIPMAGPVLFFFLGPQRLERQAIKRKREIEKVLSLSPFSLSDGGSDARRILGALTAEDRQVVTLAKRISEYPATTGNQVRLLHDPYDAFLAIQQAIREAQEFIHVEYYIIESDEVTTQLFEELVAAQKRGVEVRVLYDAFGSLSLKRIFFRKLSQAGARIAGFLPFSFLPSRMNLNFRNHRKILLIDGKVAFTGGTNIGKQYLGRRNDGQWHDYSVRVEGPVCRQLEDVFAKDWHFTTQEDLFQPRYYPPSTGAGDGMVQVLESGPDSTFQALHQAIFLAINNAREEILLTTPYFVPDPAIVSALTVAALRGVKVQIILPLKSDARLVRLASRSFYDVLLEAGVEIFEYEPRILHAKLLTIDRKWTMIGSANMDIRSFRLNFELNLLVYGSSVAQQAVQLFITDRGLSSKVELNQFLRRPLTARMLENACRLLSPIL